MIEFEIPSPAEEATREARWNIERAKMRVLDPAEWPTGATADGKLYSLECSPAMQMTEAGWGMDVDFEDMLEPVDKDPFPQPELSPVVGAYAYVAGIAARLNKDQRQGIGGVVSYIYTPALIDPLVVA